MTVQGASQRRHGPLHHVAAAVLAGAALPYGHKTLHVFAGSAVRVLAGTALPAGGAYVAAWTAFAAAYGLYHHKHTMLRLTLAWLTFLTAVTDLPVLRNTISELTGAHW